MKSGMNKSSTPKIHSVSPEQPYTSNNVPPVQQTTTGTVPAEGHTPRSPRRPEIFNP